MTLPFDISGNLRDGIEVRAGDLVFDVVNMRDVSAAAHTAYATFSDRREAVLELHLMERPRLMDATPRAWRRGVAALSPDFSRLQYELETDERIARAVQPTPLDWHVDEEAGDTVVWWPPEPEIAERERRLGVRVTSDRWQGQQFDHEPVAAHVARHDPARVLALNKVLRRIMTEAECTPGLVRHYANVRDLHRSVWMEGYAAACLSFATALAEVYGGEAS